MSKTMKTVWIVKAGPKTEFHAKIDDIEFAIGFEGEVTAKVYDLIVDCFVYAEWRHSGGGRDGEQLVKDIANIPNLRLAWRDAFERDAPYTELALMPDLPQGVQIWPEGDSTERAV